MTKESEITGPWRTLDVISDQGCQVPFAIILCFFGYVAVFAGQMCMAQFHDGQMLQQLGTVHPIKGPGHVSQQHPHHCLLSPVTRVVTLQHL